MKDLSIYRGKALVYTSQEEQVENNVFKTLNTEIKINQTQFHNIWPGFYPRKELTNQIGAGMGIEHCGEAIIEEVFGDLEEYPDGRKVRKVEGYKCRKTARRRRPDGTWQEATEFYEFNWIACATRDFLEDEEKETGKQKYTFANSPQKQARVRQKHVLELKKFAAQRASTGADLCLIRALTGMPTSFKQADINIGLMVVSQIVESDEYQAAKAKANIDNIRMGGNVVQEISSASSFLTGKPADAGKDFHKIEPDPEPETVEHEEQPGEEPTDLQRYESLLKNEKVVSMTQPNPDGSGNLITAAEYYKGVVEDNGSGPDVIAWAISEMEGLIG